LAAPGPRALSHKQRRSHDGERAIGQRAQGLFQISLDAIVEDHGTWIGAERTDEQKVVCALFQSQSGNRERVVEVHMAEALAGSGGLYGGAERADDLVRSHEGRMGRELIEVHHALLRRRTPSVNEVWGEGASRERRHLREDRCGEEEME